MKKVSYIYDNSLNQQLDKLEQITDRVCRRSASLNSLYFTKLTLKAYCYFDVDFVWFQSSLVNHLIHAYGLHSRLLVLKNLSAEDNEVSSFHSTDYINHLKSLNDVKDIQKYEDHEEYGLGILS